jgi:hypothetical protein
MSTMPDCPVCFGRNAYANAVQAAQNAQAAWERRRADLADSYAPNELPAYMLASLGEGPSMPAAPQFTIEQRLQHIEHRLDDAIADGKEA